jgi:hypothetical protein
LQHVGSLLVKATLGNFPKKKNFLNDDDIYVTLRDGHFTVISLRRDTAISGTAPWLGKHLLTHSVPICSTSLQLVRPQFVDWGF